MNNVSAKKNRRILVIDDNHAIHDDFHKILSSPTVAAAALDVTEAELFGKPVPHGGTVHQIRYEIDSAYQGQEGVLLVKQALEAGRPYAMAFVDVRMPPGMDGVETTRKIWELDPDLQVVLCTAYSDYSWDEMFEKLGQHDGLLILKKPFDTVEALQLTHALTEKWQLHQQARQKMEQLESMVAGRTQELGKSLSLLNATLESTTDGILAMDLKGNITSLNAKFAAMWQFPAEFLKRWDRAEMIPFVSRQFKDPARFLQQIKQTLSDPETETFEEIECKDGRIMERYSLPQRIDGKCVGVVVNWRDITARKRAEEALRESQAGLEFAQSMNRMGSWDLDLTKGGGQWSKEMFRLFNFDPATGTPQFNEFLVAIHPEDRARFAEAHQRVAESGEQARLEFRSDPARGPIHHLETIIQAAKGSSGPVRRLAGTVQDITERKRAEEALRENEERFSGAFEYAPIGVALVMPDGRYLKVNRVLCELVGYSEAELLARTFQDITHPEDLEVDLENVRQLLAGETRSYQMEKRYVHARGHLVTVLLNVSLVRDGQGQPRYFVSQVQDITQRKQAEAALRDSEERYRQLFDLAADAVILVDSETHRYVDVNQAAQRLYGYSREEFLQMTPEDVSDEPEKTRDHISAGDAHVPFRWHRKKNGERFAVEIKANQIIHQGRRTALVTLRDVTARQQAEAALRDGEAFLNTVIENIPHMIFVKDVKELRFVKFNKAGQELLGYSLADLAGKNDYDLFAKEMADHFTENDREVLRGREIVDIPEESIQTREKGERTLHTKKIPILDNAGQLVYLLGISEDITERKRLETQLIQSQKMETVGKLAGGIAHEFNSILTAIIGQSELLREELPAGSPLAQNTIEISKAADRAAVLTRQLLAYGRKQLLRPEALNLNHVITSMDGVLCHLMGGQLVDVKIVPAAGLQLVKADAGQIEQVIMNMAMNARDAMPHGGRLTMETANVTLDQDSVGRYPELKPGGYVMLAISDTGAGMGENVKARVFEPFFTTKDVGQGTGLGLSTCYGIIKQSGGHISVYSEHGRGTTFKIYLPQVEAPPKIPVERLDSPELPRGTETILLVEDDPALREMAATLLKRLGYTVLAAANGIEALNLKQQRDNGHIDLLFTDVVMPHMSGKELADRVRVLYPHTKILFTSAYTEHAIIHQGLLDPGVALLQKPFTPSALARKLREVLDAPAAPQPDAARKTSGN